MELLNVRLLCLRGLPQKHACIQNFACLQIICTQTNAGFWISAWNTFNSWRISNNSTSGSGENRKGACTVCWFNRDIDQRPQRHRNSPVSGWSCIASCSYDNADSLKAELKRALWKHRHVLPLLYSVFPKYAEETFACSFCCWIAVLLCLHFHKAALGSRAECGKKAPRRFTLTVFPLILVLLLIILSSAPIRPSKPDMAEPVGGEAAQSVTTRQGWRHYWGQLHVAVRLSLRTTGNKALSSLQQGDQC